MNRSAHFAPTESVPPEEYLIFNAVLFGHRARIGILLLSVKLSDRLKMMINNQLEPLGVEDLPMETRLLWPLPGAGHLSEMETEEYRCRIRHHHPAMASVYTV